MARKRTGKCVKSHVLFYPSHVKGRWVAHCLEIDMTGTGENPQEAFEELLGTMEVQFELWKELGKKAAPPKRAPKEFWDAAKKGMPLPDVAVRLGEWAKKWKKRGDGRFPAPPESCEARLITKAELVPA